MEKDKVDIMGSNTVRRVENAKVKSTKEDAAFSHGLLKVISGLKIKG